MAIHMTSRRPVQGARIQVPVTAKRGLIILAVAAMIGSAMYWWNVQSQFTANAVVAAVYTAILTVAPPAVVSFLLPSSRSGMMLRRMNATTYAYPVLIVIGVVLVFYTGVIQWFWWAQQQIVVDSNLVIYQVVVGIIGFVFVPAVFWIPVTRQELQEEAEIAQALAKMQLEYNSEVALLRQSLAKLYRDSAKDMRDKAQQAQLGADFERTITHVVERLDVVCGQMGEVVRAVSSVDPGIAGSIGNDAEITRLLQDIATHLKQPSGTASDGALRHQLPSALNGQRLLPGPQAQIGFAPVPQNMTVEQQGRYGEKSPESGRLRVQQ